MEGSDGPPMTCEEHEELLLRLRDWRTRLSMELPKIEVRFEDVSVETEVYVRRRVLPTLPNAIINTAQVDCMASELHNLSLAFATSNMPPMGKDHTREDEGDFVVNYILKITGLDECADTLIGDEMRRGISGGQKKRVTVGRSRTIDLVSLPPW
ncbi:hypothetical protein BHE74_00030662 [Ensete ventricosum]|nr:hypothetical protein BHE74_00030662 [Ensete ventricosum]